MISVEATAYMIAEALGARWKARKSKRMRAATRAAPARGPAAAAPGKDGAPPAGVLELAAAKAPAAGGADKAAASPPAFPVEASVAEGAAGTPRAAGAPPRSADAPAADGAAGAAKVRHRTLPGSCRMHACLAACDSAAASGARRSGSGISDKRLAARMRCHPRQA